MKRTCEFLLENYKITILEIYMNVQRQMKIKFKQMKQTLSELLRKYSLTRIKMCSIRFCPHELQQTKLQVLSQFINIRNPQAPIFTNSYE